MRETSPFSSPVAKTLLELGFYNAEEIRRLEGVQYQVINAGVKLAPGTVVYEQPFFGWCGVCQILRKRANFCPRCGRRTRDGFVSRSVLECLFDDLRAWPIVLIDCIGRWIRGNA